MGEWEYEEEKENILAFNLFMNHSKYLFSILRNKGMARRHTLVHLCIHQSGYEQPKYSNNNTIQVKIQITAKIKQD